MPLRHHPGVQVLGILAADGEEASVLICLTWYASEQSFADVLGQHAGGLLPTAVSFTSSIITALRTLGRVDAMQPNASIPHE